MNSLMLSKFFILGLSGLFSSEIFCMNPGFLKRVRENTARVCVPPATKKSFVDPKILADLKFEQVLKKMYEKEENYSQEIFDILYRDPNIVHHQDGSMATLLHYAVEWMCDAVVLQHVFFAVQTTAGFLQYDRNRAIINFLYKKNSDGRTALHLAAIKNNKKVTDYLFHVLRAAVGVDREKQDAAIRRYSLVPDKYGFKAEFFLSGANETADSVYAEVLKAFPDMSLAD